MARAGSGRQRIRRRDIVKKNRTVVERPKMRRRTKASLLSSLGEKAMTLVKKIRALKGFSVVVRGKKIILINNRRVRSTITVSKKNPFEVVTKLEKYLKSAKRE